MAVNMVSFANGWCSSMPKPVDPEDFIRIAMYARLVKEDNIKSLFHMNEMYDNADFNNEFKGGKLRKAVMKHASLSKFLQLKELDSYEAVKGAITEYVHISELFISSIDFKEIRPATSKGVAEMMRNDVQEI